jgi:hypothetical protein
MDSRDLVPMAQGCPRSPGMGKPLGLVDLGGHRALERADERRRRASGEGDLFTGGLLLKIRLEASKRISNARLDFMDRVYDQSPIFEQYLA